MRDSAGSAANGQVAEFMNIKLLARLGNESHG
jgi:hypothetical protein